MFNAFAFNAAPFNTNVGVTPPAIVLQQDTIGAWWDDRGGIDPWDLASRKRKKREAKAEVPRVARAWPPVQVPTKRAVPPGELADALLRAQAALFPGPKPVAPPVAQQEPADEWDMEMVALAVAVVLGNQ